MKAPGAAACAAHLALSFASLCLLAACGPPPRASMPSTAAQAREAAPRETDEYSRYAVSHPL